MRMKKIQAADMQEALQIARREIGDDAIMLQSQKVAGGGIIVTFALDDDDLHDHQQFADTPPAPKPVVKETPPTLKPRDSASALQLAEDVFRWHGAPKNLQATILEAARRTKQVQGEIVDATQDLLSDALAHSLKFAPITGERTQRAIMCVGTPGVGKTYTIAKLATDAVKRGASVHVITTDTSRPSAYDQLAAFTEILGIPLDIAESRAKLRELLRGRTPDTYTLIDTAGCNPYDFQELKQLGELAKQQEIEPVLILSLGIDASEAQEIAGVFSFLDIERLLITRVDCARRMGGVLAAVEAGQYALSNTSASLKVADGCPPLTSSSLAELLLRPARERLS